ncbi:MAG TPA: DUF72 domain-containing protein [Candidatus Acidoferrum sp.]|nr:DUF72 domain-containing protein [Candidatus Acidoferrum sp.]
MSTETQIHIGTSAFTAAGWPGSFYPAGLKPAEYLSYYATKFSSVELDNTFYRTPALSTVKGWYAKTPPNFVFAAKVPQVITHEKVLVDCAADLAEFLTAMDALGEKLGALLFQFGYFNSSAFKSQSDFLDRLKPFLKSLPSGYRFAVEIRNKWWLDARLTDLFREHGVALALIDQSWVPRPWEMKRNLDLVTADFSYIRWLGDRKEIESLTMSWDKIVVDRTADLNRWAEIARTLIHQRKLQHLFLFANNHYAGHGPATVQQFLSMDVLGRQM